MQTKRLRRRIIVLSAVSVALLCFAGCGDDDSGSSSVDAGSDVAPDRSTVDVTADTGADARSPEFTGSPCQAPTDCYQDLDGASLKGEAVCITKVTNGYCTHKCTTDADCCAVSGECRTGLKQVCAPFENTGDKYCFLSCEDGDIAAASDAGASDAGLLDGGGTDGDGYCHQNASNEFGCRSTGGGSDNRKACLPVGAPGDGGNDGALDAPLDAPDGG